MHTNFNLDEHVGPGTRRNKVVTAQEAVRLIHDGDTVATSGFVGIGFAEEIAVALESRFLATQLETGVGTPAQLTLVYVRWTGRRPDARPQSPRPLRHGTPRGGRSLGY